MAWNSGVLISCSTDPSVVCTELFEISNGGSKFDEVSCTNSSKSKDNFTCQDRGSIPVARETSMAGVIKFVNSTHCGTYCFWWTGEIWLAVFTLSVGWVMVEFRGGFIGKIGASAVCQVLPHTLTWFWSIDFISYHFESKQFSYIATRERNCVEDPYSSGLHIWFPTALRLANLISNSFYRP